MALHEASPRRESATIEVPRGEWEEFFNRFTEFNQEMAARLELTRSPHSGHQVLVDERPFLAITLDAEEGPAHVVLEIGDTAGASPAAYRHIVQEPVAIRARKTEPVGWDALEIETAAHEAFVLTINPHPAAGAPSLEEAGTSETRAS